MRKSAIFMGISKYRGIMMKNASSLFVMIFAVFCFSFSYTATYYVNGTTGNDTYDGLAETWDGTHGPKKTIQAGINASVSSNSLPQVLQENFQIGFILFCLCPIITNMFIYSKGHARTHHISSLHHSVFNKTSNIIC